MPDTFILALLLIRISEELRKWYAVIIITKKR